MQKDYNLSSSMSDRIRFDEMAARIAGEWFETLPFGDDDVNPIGLQDCIVGIYDAEDIDSITDDPEEARARFFDAFIKATVEVYRDCTYHIDPEYVGISSIFIDSMPPEVAK